MVWTIRFEERALKELKKLDKKIQRDILRYFRERLESENEPRRFGKPLIGDKYGLWPYRVGDYRMIFQIKDDELIILILRVAHRRHVYN